MIAAKEIHYRGPTLIDVDELSRLHVLCWQQAYATLLPTEYLRDLSVEQRAANWRRTIADSEVFVELACLGDRILGFVSAGPARPEALKYGDGEIYAIYLHADFYNSGIGGKLLTAAQHFWASNNGNCLVVFYIADNVRAGNFYKSKGGISVHDGIYEVAGVSVAEKGVVFRSPQCSLNIQVTP